MEFFKEIAKQTNLPNYKVKNVIELLENKNTIPFIARYRKELTGNLNEVDLRLIQDEYNRIKALESRRNTVLQTIAQQGNLTEQLQAKIQKADNLSVLEDLYLPYRPKRRTKAMAARELGLEPLSKLIVKQLVSEKGLAALIRPFTSPEVPELESALSGAEDIVAELINEHAVIRGAIREQTLKYGRVDVKFNPEGEDPSGVYEMYYQFNESIKRIQPHQVLAINRGEKEKVLKVQTIIPEQTWAKVIADHFPANQNSVFYSALNRAIDDCANRLLLPAIARDVRRHLTEVAEQHAIKVFAENLQALLTQPPLINQVILAIDPGFRTGSKVAVIDPTGKVLATSTIYPHPPQKETNEAHKILENLIDTYHVSLIVIGNGTASRETEAFVAEFTKKSKGLNYLITSEAGASVYSASKIARDEFPNLDVSIRGAVSIGRRIHDPLAELVKIDPKAIGVGLYQHDINQTLLSEALDQVVESVVNNVGVDVNTASSSLLTHVAGIGPTLAEKIIKYREENGPFRNRNELLSVPGMGPKTFEQSAGFLRIRDGQQPLDATAIHPESYPLAIKILKQLALPSGIKTKERIKAINTFKQNTDLKKLAADLQTGLPTLEDILDEIARPGRDPREDLPKPLLRKDVLSMDDLKPGMTLMGTIRNVVDFGAFVDIGVKTDGLLHRSQINRGIKLRVGEIRAVEILSVDHERNRISLGMKESTPA